MLHMRDIRLDELNSLTKYPSIPTYHTLDPKNGILLSEVTKFDGAVVMTEKIDGTNGRVIVLPDGNYIIGSREELLYARGDLIGNPSQGIVSALRQIAAPLSGEARDDGAVVFYLEVYGGKTTANAKQYTSRQEVAARLFDVAVIDGLTQWLVTPRDRIAAWRDGGGQHFLGEDALMRTSLRCELEAVPRVGITEATALPLTIDDTLAFLKHYGTETRVALDAEAGGKAEGIVFRTRDRSVIAKARVDDYERTLRKKGKS